MNIILPIRSNMCISCIRAVTGKPIGLSLAALGRSGFEFGDSKDPISWLSSLFSCYINKRRWEFLRFRRIEAISFHITFNSKFCCYKNVRTSIPATANSDRIALNYVNHTLCCKSQWANSTLTIHLPYAVL